MLVGDSIGLIHLIASVAALIAGTWVLLAAKGTARHRRVGYVYAASMSVLIVTAFMIWRLFGGYGLFHLAAAVSAVTLVGGMVPVILRRPRGNWLGYHFSFMYWSVMGLYAAFVAEVLTRIPQTPFFRMVSLATGGVMVLGYAGFFVMKKRWLKLLPLYLPAQPDAAETRKAQGSTALADKNRTDPTKIS